MKKRRSGQGRYGLIQLGLSAILTISTTVLLSGSALAGLGGDITSVQADQAHMQGTLRSTQNQGFMLHEIQSPTGTVVREYVSPAGKVFAVAWQGPFPPDMRQILADSFGQFQQAAAAQVSAHAGRRPLVLHQSGLIIEAVGHLRSFSGRAYLPQLLPQGVSAEAIR